MNDSTLHRKLLLFPTDVWDNIAESLEGDELTSLFLLGDAALSARLRRISKLTIVWNSAAYCNWTRYKSLIAGFGNLKTLSLKASVTFHISPSLLDCTKLPSNLTSLSLHYGGSICILGHDKRLLAFKSLTNLSVRDESRENMFKAARISFDRIPPSVVHLTLYAAAPSKYCYIVDEVNRISRELKTLNMNLPPNSDSIKFNPGTYSLTDLRLLACPTNFRLDIDHVAPTLLRLELNQGHVFHNDRRLFFLWSGPPYRDLLPQLHTLILPDSISWTALETLPLSLTRIGGLADLNAQSQPGLIEELQIYNDAYLKNSDQDRPGAPAMIRHLILTHSQSNLLPLFPSLETLISPGSYWMGPFTPLQQNLRSIKIGRIASSVALLPPSLTSISCEVLVIKQPDSVNSDTAANSSIEAIETPIKLSHLVKLSMKSSRISYDILAMLPATIEHLEGTIATQDVLEALTHKVNVQREMPLLSTLVIKIAIVEGASRMSICLDTIPLTIKTLTLAGAYELKPPQDGTSLRHHPTLTSINFNAPGSAASLLPVLPPQLLKLKVLLFNPIDLNNLADVEALAKLPPKLRDLSISLFRGPHLTWFIPLTQASLGLLPSVAKPIALEVLSKLSKQSKSSQERLFSPPSLYMVSECLISTFLPRTLSSIAMPIPSAITLQIEANAFTYHLRASALPPNLSHIDDMDPALRSAYFDIVQLENP